MRALSLLLALALLMAAVERWGGARVEGAGRALLAELVEEGDARPVLLFAFHAADCPAYGSLLEQWEAVERSGEARVVGVMLGERGRPKDSEPPELDFPLRPELARATERLVVGLGFHQTPVSVLLDATGRVRLAVATPPDAAAQAAAVRQVTGHLQWLSTESP